MEVWNGLFNKRLELIERESWWKGPKGLQDTEKMARKYKVCTYNTSEQLAREVKRKNLKADGWVITELASYTNAQVLTNVQGTTMMVLEKPNSKLS